MSGETLDFKNHLRLHIGKYFQVHQEEIPYNSQASRTKGIIYLGLSGNLKVRYKFMALNSGKKIFRRNWDLITIPYTVIYRLNTFCGDQTKLLTFTDRHRCLIGDIETLGVGDD